MYVFILSGMALCLVAGLYWMIGKWALLYGIDTKGKRLWVIRLGIAVFAGSLCLIWSVAGLVEVHLIILFAIVEFTAFLIRNIAKNHTKKKRYSVFRRLYHSGIIPILVTCLMMGYGSLNMGQIIRTEYTVTSEKLQSGYEVVLITDTHYGTVQNPDILIQKIEEINALHPDIILLCGDIVEEGTTRESMQEAFRILGSLESTYGTYFVYGNHDRQDYRTAVSRSRTYTDEELVQAIEENGIKILCDKWINIGEDLVLAGREDAARISGRVSSKELLRGADQNRFIIVADHQPIEAEENAAEGADLQLSGHTHAGQAFPAGLFMRVMGMPCYGEYQESGCKLIISSGASVGVFPIRTEKHCEYVVIELKQSHGSN